jgi:hypothetical protein
VVHTIYHQMVKMNSEKLEKKKWKQADNAQFEVSCESKQSCHNTRYHPRICLHELRKTRKS